MAWFKVDDQLHDHHKTRRLRRSHDGKQRDVAPFGLWVLAGSWCGENRTHGFIPTEVLLDFDEDAEQLAERLVKAGFWSHDEMNGEPGYRFHDWGDQNPIDVDDPSEYGRRGNHIRWHEKRAIVDPDCTFCTVHDRGDIGATVDPNRGGESSRPDPSRPDPTRRTPALRASDLDADPAFIAFWSAYPRRTDKGHARKAWLAKVVKAKVEPADVIEAARAFALASRGTDPRFVAHPATWLNGERWLDADPTTQPVHDDDYYRNLPPSRDQLP